MNQKQAMTTHFLEEHFSKVVRLRFFIEGVLLEPEMVFEQSMLLLPIAMAANDLSKHIYGRDIIKGIVPDESPNAPFHARVELREDISGLDLLLLVAAAEEFFGVAADEPSETEFREIEVLPLFEQMSKPAGERVWH